MKKAVIKRPTRMETAVIKRPTISYICLYRDIVTTELLLDNAGIKGSFSGIHIFVLSMNSNVRHSWTAS
jgi:hypothetical protein